MKSEVVGTVVEASKVQVGSLVTMLDVYEEGKGVWLVLGDDSSQKHFTRCVLIHPPLYRGATHITIGRTDYFPTENLVLLPQGLSVKLSND